LVPRDPGPARAQALSVERFRVAELVSDFKRGAGFLGSVELRGRGVRQVPMPLNFGALAAASVEASMRHIAREGAPRVNRRRARTPAP